MEYLNKLIGNTITDISSGQGTYYPLNEPERSPQIVDHLYITIEDYSLTISNKIIFGKNIESMNMFLGKTIKEINEANNEIKITTEDDNWFIVDLREEAYVGPEAMSLHGPENLLVVWN